MKPLDMDALKEYVNANITDFHQRRIKSLENLDLKMLLNKNPYLFKAKVGQQLSTRQTGRGFA